MPRTKARKYQQQPAQKQLFVVKDIIDYMSNQDGEKYLVHWKGYSKESSTWETVDNIKACDDEGWDETLETCRQRTFKREQRKGELKTKMITPAGRSDRFPQRQSAKGKIELSAACQVFADLLVKYRHQLQEWFIEGKQLVQRNEDQSEIDHPFRQPFSIENRIIQSAMDLQEEESEKPLEEEPEKEMTTSMEIEGEDDGPKQERTLKRREFGGDRRMISEKQKSWMSGMKVVGLSACQLEDSKLFFKPVIINKRGELEEKTFMLAEKTAKNLWPHLLQEFNKFNPIEIDSE